MKMREDERAWIEAMGDLEFEREMEDAALCRARQKARERDIESSAFDRGYASVVDLVTSEAYKYHVNLALREMTGRAVRHVTEAVTRYLSTIRAETDIRHRPETRETVARLRLPALDLNFAISDRDVREVFMGRAR